MKKTQEEIQKLKDNWAADPCWDIETEEGFEDHFEELLTFRKEQEAEWQRNAEDRIARRARVVAVETNVLNSTIAQSIYTFEEIENEVVQAQKHTESDSDSISIAQVRATLLLAAQVMRIADALEARNKSDEEENNQEFMTRLYKVE